ncbi:MAG: PAS domain S-box protein, partial [Anaerolineales bacterium]
QEYRILTASREVRWVDDRTWVERDAKGRIQHYQGIILDITDRKKVEEALRESEAHLRLITDNMVDVISQTDDRLNVLYSSPSLERVFGYQPQTIVGKTAAGWMHPDDIEPAIQKAAEARQAGLSSVRIEYRWRRADGEYLWVESSTRLLLDENGQSAGAIFASRDISDRKRLEHETEERRLFLENVLAAAPDAIIVSDTRHIISEWNPGAERLFGYSSEEAVGRKVDDLITGTDPQVHDEAVQWTREIQSWRGITSTETVRYRKDGSPVNVVVSVAPILSGNEWAGVVAVYSDITERKQVEEALRESEEKYRAFIENLPIGVYRTTPGPQGKVLIANSAYLKMFGSSTMEELTQINVADLYANPLERENFSDSLLAQGHVHRVELNMKRRNGSLMWAAVTASVAHNDKGEIYFDCAMEDITERKQVEEALRESEEKYRRLVEVSPIPMWINKDGIITYMNPAALRVIGATHLDQVVGKVAMDFIHPDYQATVNERVRQMTEEEKTVPLLEEKYVRLDGSIFDVDVTAAPFTTFGGPAIQVLFQDITQRKLNEAEREALIRELEAKNAELERFTYTVSHDLKAPLITIRGFLGYIEQDALSGDMERLKADIRRIVAATDKLHRLLNELLELSRIGRLMNPPENVALGDLVQEVLKLMEGRLRQTDAQVQVQADLPVVFGDAQRLQEVIQNLLDNALKFVRQQTRPVIQIGTSGEEHDMPIIYVRDNGIGIAPEHHERIFGLFNKLNPEIDGTGVGLTIVKRIVEVHGGRIWVESEPGRGATFYFTLSNERTHEAGK